MTVLTQEIFLGWKVASMMSNVTLLGAERVVDANVSVRVAGRAEAGNFAGNPFLVWAHESLMSEDKCRLHPEKNLVLWQSVNNENQTCMRTLGAFSRLVRNEEEAAPDAEAAETNTARLEFAFIASALRMFWGYRADLAQQLAPACKHFAMLAGIDSCDGVWGRGAWKTLPVAAPRRIRALSCDGSEIGRLIREWHDEVFSKFLMVEAWPIVAGPHESVPYQSVIDRGADVVTRLVPKRDSVTVNGNDDWRSLTEAELEHLVWSYPRQQLANILGVTDMAIHKRCKKLLVAQPPRGFWQKVRGCTASEMSFFLFDQGVEAPKWWRLANCKRGLEEIESAEGVRALLPKQELVEG